MKNLWNTYSKSWPDMATLGLLLIIFGGWAVVIHWLITCFCIVLAIAAFGYASWLHDMDYEDRKQKILDWYNQKKMTPPTGFERYL